MPLVLCDLERVAAVTALLYSRLCVWLSAIIQLPNLRRAAIIIMALRCQLRRGSVTCGWLWLAASPCLFTSCIQSVRVRCRLIYYRNRRCHRVVLQFSIIKHIAAIVHDLQRCFLQRFHAVVLGDRNDIRSTKICVTYHSVSWFPGRMS